MLFRAFAALSALIFCLLALLFLPDIGAQAARDALALCAQTVIPSLFPFFVLSSLLVWQACAIWSCSATGSCFSKGTGGSCPTARSGST